MTTPNPPIFASVPNAARVARLLTTTPPTTADLLARVRRGGKGKGRR
jgi:hypothetical protein